MATKDFYAIDLEDAEAMAVRLRKRGFRAEFTKVANSGYVVSASGGSQDELTSAAQSVKHPKDHAEHDDNPDEPNAPPAGYATDAGDDEPY